LEVALPVEFRLQSAGDSTFRFIIDPTLCTGPTEDRYLFGGVGVAAAMQAMEQLSGRSALWVSAQFLSPGKVGETLELTQTFCQQGRAVTQHTILATIGGEPVLQATGATSAARPAAEDRTWIDMEAVPGPELAKSTVVHNTAHEDVHARFDIRPFKGRFGMFVHHPPFSDDGKVLAWFKPLVGGVDRTALAIIADFIPAVITNAMGTRTGGRSIDNLIRFVRLVPTEWVLAEFHVLAVANGCAHGRVTLFAQDGTLLAFGSQSFRLAKKVRRAETSPS
jgi:acyl-CoA thioesterase-2